MLHGKNVNKVICQIFPASFLSTVNINMQIYSRSDTTRKPTVRHNCSNITVVVGLTIVLMMLVSLVIILY